MEGKFERFKNSCFSITSRFFKNYKNYLLVFFIVFLFGFLTGIFTCSNYVADLTCENLINKYLYSFLCGDMTFFSYFLTLSIFYIIICLFTILLVRNKFMVVINVFILFLMSYVFGFDICIVIMCLGLSGIIFGVLFFGLFFLCVFLMYMCIMSIICKAVINIEKCEYTFKVVFINCLYFILASLILLFLSSLLFSIIHIFVIVD